MRRVGIEVADIFRQVGPSYREDNASALSSGQCRVLLHALTGGFHGIRHYGLIVNKARKGNIAHARKLLHVVPDAVVEAKSTDEPIESVRPTFLFAHCDAPMIITHAFVR